MEEKEKILIVEDRSLHRRNAGKDYLELSSFQVETEETRKRGLKRRLWKIMTF